jgi:hypothetical protein
VVLGLVTVVIVGKVVYDATGGSSTTFSPPIGVGNGTVLNSENAEDLPTGDDVVIDGKVGGQIEGRGWTEEEIRDLTLTEPTGKSVDKRSPGKTDDGQGRDDPATVYGTPDGGHIVVNDVTGEVVHVSDKSNPNWAPDDRIEWNDGAQ